MSSRLVLRLRSLAASYGVILSLLVCLNCPAYKTYAPCDEKLAGEIGGSGFNWTDVSPDGTRLLYDDSGRLYEMRLSTSIASEIKAARIIPQEVAWGAHYSSDGKRIAFALSGREPRDSCPSNVYVLDLKSGKRDQVTHQGGGVESPFFSPDGKKIAYQKANELYEPGMFAGPAPGWKNYDLYTIGTDGTEEKRLTSESYLSSVSSLSWSPDGKALLYSTPLPKEHIADQTDEIVRLETDAKSPPTPLTIPNFKTPEENNWNCMRTNHSPSYSPDGRKIAFIAYQGPYDCKSNEIWQIWTMAADGSRQRQITDFKRRLVEDAMFDRSGRRIIFRFTCTKEEYGPYAEEFWSIKPDGSDSRRLLRLYAQPGAPDECSLN